MKIKTVVWNMNHRSKRGNWEVLREHPDFAGADIALLCEATAVPEGPEANGRKVISNGSTKGLDCRCTDAPDVCMKRTYSTAVVSPRPLGPMPEDTRVRWGECLPFRPSRPGTWTAARVKVDEITVTAIALYGLNDEDYDSSVHRSLSELSPVFDHEVYGKHLVLGDDLNILAGKQSRSRPYRGHLALERIKAYGLRGPCLPAATRTPFGEWIWITASADWGRAASIRGPTTTTRGRTSRTKTTTYSHRGPWPTATAL